MTFRLISRLDIKPPHLVKGVHLEGVRKLGNPYKFATEYYNDGIDEIFYQDVIASLYGRNSISELVKQTARHVFIPVTVGGGIRTIQDIQTMLRSGADKISLNTMAIKNPDFIREASRIFGVQCIVLALEVISCGAGKWEPLIDCGRQHTGLDAVEWAMRAVDLGAGELLITSIGVEGTKKGFDFSFAEELMDRVNVPIILHGGAGTVQDIVEVAKRGYSGAVVSSMLHYKLVKIQEIKEKLAKENIEVRL